MLTSLSIRNIAIIDELEIDFERGLNVMTGETGAGKTIIAQSLGLVLGGRAQPDMIRTGEEEAEVTASFYIDSASPARPHVMQLLEGSGGIDEEDGDIIIRRVISTQGRGKITINGIPATLQMLKALAPHLVDVSSQHEHQLLIDPASHVDVVDGYGVAKELTSRYREAFQRYSELANEVQRLRDEEASAKERLDFLKFQRDELKAAAPQPDELDELEEKRMRLKHAATLDATAREAFAALYEAPGSMVGVLDRIAKQLSSTARLDPAFQPWSETLERARMEIEEIARDVRQYVERLEAEPERLEEIEDRIHLLRGLVRKHGGSLEDVLRKMDVIAQDIDRTERYDEVLAAKGRALAVAEEELKDAAKQLSEARTESGKKLAKEVQRELEGLAMGKVRFVLDIEPLPRGAWDVAGSDRVEFFIAPNVGEELKPLVRIASGGELSRVMLAIKRVIADKANLAATYIFDEVDSGIGGAVAEVVGRKLMEVAQSRQVICITHLPQVACCGSAHYRIGKRVEKGRTRAHVLKLTHDHRIEEIARMLGGRSITELTRRHAEELLRHGSGQVDT